jgi:nucleoside-diphosphate-sugar epimerase
MQGDGMQTRSFIFIDDFTTALMLLLNKAENLEIYNIGTDKQIAIRELALIIAQKMDMKINLIFGSLTKGSPKKRSPDVSKLTKLGFSPKISLTEGLDRTINWYLKQ